MHEKTHDFEVGRNIQIEYQKQSTEENEKLDFNKMKNLNTLKDTIKKTKDRWGENYCNMYIYVYPMKKISVQHTKITHSLILRQKPNFKKFKPKTIHSH